MKLGHSHLWSQLGLNLVDSISHSLYHFQMMDYYTLLEVERNASSSDIKKAYRYQIVHHNSGTVAGLSLKPNLQETGVEMAPRQEP